MFGCFLVDGDCAGWAAFAAGSWVLLVGLSVGIFHFFDAKVL